MPQPVSYNGRTVIHLKPGDVIEDCRYHPCEVIDVDLDDRGDDNNIHMRSLVTGGEGYCDAIHCGIRLLSSEEVEEWRATGIVDYRGLIDYWSNK